jgi:hypothetical protein
MRWWLALVVVTGCNRVFGLSDTALVDGGNGFCPTALSFSPGCVTTTDTVTLDHDIVTDTMCPGTIMTSACVVAGQSIIVASSIHVTGTLPLALVATSMVEIDGAIDVGSHAGVAGAGADPGCTSPALAGGLGPTMTANGGGGGGGDQQRGGTGGSAGGEGGAGGAVQTLAVHGGCAGGEGGGVGPAGDGGGALIVIAGGSIKLAADLLAGGGGGQGAGVGALGGGDGGGGGGSGGLVLLDAPHVTVANAPRVCANGGGGGGSSGSPSPMVGNAGEDGCSNPNNAVAQGGQGAQQGGAGSVGTTAPVDLPVVPMGMGGGGGAGGGAGYIVIIGATSLGTAAASPPATFM